jgi:hypothetical protein
MGGAIPVVVLAVVEAVAGSKEQGRGAEDDSKDDQKQFDIHWD